MAKGKKKNIKPRIELSESEKSWQHISNNPPPIPKKKKSIRYEALPWKNIETSDAMLVSDDMGGVLGFEELEGVDCEWVENQSGGKTLEFKVVNEDIVKKNKKKVINYDLPLSENEMKQNIFIHVDDFVEGDESQENNKEEKVERRNKRPLVLRPESDSEEGEDDEEIDKEMKDEIYEEDEIEEEKEESEEDKKAISNEDEAFDFKTIETVSKKKKEKKEKKEAISDIVEEEEFTFTITPMISNWIEYNLNDKILKAIQDKEFDSPTEIQKKVLPLALKGKDIIGCAETGSGKTLAFGLPILNKLSYIDTNLEKNQKLFGLILTPTRELAIQIKEHLKAISKYIRVKIEAIVGGMSIQKQERLLNNIPHVIIATPGRLWELITQSNFNKNLIQNIKYLVLDEADRMIEKGHFKELQFILELLNKNPSSHYQSFIFSATMSNNITTKDIKNKNKKHKKVEESTIGQIIKTIKFKNGTPIQIDITSKKVTSEKLVETRIDCVKNEKDLYLYFFITRYPGRTLVFVNSIDSIRRLVPIFKNLNLNVYPLHAQMQQRQRLKNVDKFKTEDSCVLICSDVASRGLDIPNVEYIVHYQLPRTKEIYVHRSGRTARAKKQGLSLLLCCPEEIKVYQNLCKQLKRQSIQEFPVDNLLAAKLKDRITLAKEIDQIQHTMDKEKADKSWVKKSAEELDIELDSEFESSEDEDNNKSINKKKQIKLDNLKFKLKNLLNQPILGLGYSSKYLTNNSNSNLIDILNENINDDGNTFKGLKKVSALNIVKKK